MQKQKQIIVTLKNKLGSFSITLVPNQFSSYDSLAWSALVELQKLGKPVTKHDLVSFENDSLIK